jgi:GGDEF domain-containing protein
VYGFVAGDDLLRFTAMLISEVVDEMGTTDDFIGHPGGDSFIVITAEERAQQIRQSIKSRFTEEVLAHYSFIDREQGYVVTINESGQQLRTPLMSMSVGVVSPNQFEFADIREITELAAEARRTEG